MDSSQQEKKRQRKQLIERRIVIATVAILFLGVAMVLWILNSQGIIQGSWSNIALIIFTFLGVLIGLFQWLFPMTSGGSGGALPVAHPTLAAQGVGNGASTIPPIIVHLPPEERKREVAASTEKINYRGIMSVPPPTDARTIQQRERAVKEIYTQVTRADTTAVVLTGIAGVGKSTLAALVYRYAEEERRAQRGYFSDPAIWLTIDPAVTMADLAGNLFEVFGKPVPDFSTLSLQHQAMAIFNVLNTNVDEAEGTRLIVLDQFENLLDWQTGHALADRPGVGEWLDAINSQACSCRILMTTRLWPLGTREYPPTYMQEYTVRGLQLDEGVELLRKLGVQGPDENLRDVVQRASGHAFALTLLASLLRTRHLTLAAFFDDPTYARVWHGNVARNLLDHIYGQQLSAEQRQLLLAFSIYREPVSLEAVQTLLEGEPRLLQEQAQLGIEALLAQHLLQAVGDGRYQLHAIVASFALDHFDRNDVSANKQMVREAREQAAQYYLKVAASYPARGQRRKISDVQPLIEATWQLCQAQRWQEAFALIEREDLFSSLKSWGGNAILLELYKLLLPVEKWKPTSAVEALIYNNLGVIYRTLGRRELSRSFLERSMKVCEETGERKELAWSLNHLGRWHADAGEKEQARDYYERALQLARAESERIAEGAALNNLGWVYSAWGQREKEQQYYEEALNIYREVGDKKGVAATLNNLGRVYDDLGKGETALDYYQQALQIFQQVGDRRGEGWSLNNLGKAHASLGHETEARRYFEQALNVRKEVDRKGESRTLNNLGVIYLEAGEDARAWKCYTQALDITDEITDREGRGKILRNVGLYFLQQRHYPSALACLLESKRLLEEVQSPVREWPQDSLDRLQKEVGDDEFFALLASVEPEVEQLVAKALQAKEPMRG